MISERAMQEQYDKYEQLQAKNAELEKEVARLIRFQESYGPAAVEIQKQAWVEADRQRQISELRQSNVELTAEVGHWKSEAINREKERLTAFEQIIELRKQLAIAEEHNKLIMLNLTQAGDKLVEAELDNARLREALESVSTAKERGFGIEYAKGYADKALSLPASSEALDKYVAEKAKEDVRRG